MKINVLAFGAHPDDVELGAGGILATHAMRGLTTGIVDLSRGEMGTRGTPELRDEEAKDAAAILGCSVRLNLEMPDGRIDYSHESQLQVVRVLRKYQPDIVLMNAPTDRHPDHGRASRLVEEACFLSGLHKIVIKDGDTVLEPSAPLPCWINTKPINSNATIRYATINTSCNILASLICRLANS